MQNPVHRDYSKHIHMRARAHTHTYTHKHSDYAKLTLCSLKQAATEMVEDSSMEQKAWQVYSFGKRNVFRLHLKESREGFCQRGSRSFHVDGLKTENAVKLL